MLMTLCNELGCGVEEVRAKAKNLETRILHNYSDFSVYTIDSFTQKIIQTFAYDLDIPLNYKVILEKDEIVTETLAVIYEKQSKFDNAIAVYEKLMLKYPEKKSIFANRIEVLKSKLESSK